MPETLPLSARLKSETHDQHIRAERHPVQHSLVGGRTTTAEYIRYLEQMHHMHEGFERALRRAAAANPTVGAFVQEHHYRLPQLRQDLAFFQVTDPAGPSEGTQRFTAWVDDLATSDPLSLIGVLYVLEGSTNGGRFIARALRRALSLSDGGGTAFFDPHGETQSERWGAFKRTLDQLALPDATQDAIVAAASRTFDAIVDIMDCLAPPQLAVTSP